MTRLLPLLVLVVGCREWPDYAGAFQLPSALGVLQPELGTPFQEPVGFVGNQHGGQIALLALKQGRYLTDDPTVAFLRGNQLATGHQRILSGLVPYVHPDRTVTVFAFDRFFQQIVEIPYVSGFDANGFPIEPPATHTEPVFSDADGSGDSPVVEDVELKTGWTATEDWTIRYDGTAWVVSGSRSGLMPDKAESGQRFVGVDRNLAFTLTGAATAGDFFTLSTATGSTEHDAGGTPISLRVAPDQSVAAVVLEDEVSGAAVLRLFDPLDPAGFATAPAVELGFGATPGRVAWDAGNADLFVSDLTDSAAWHIHFDDPADRATYTVERLALPWPTLDVAPLLTEVGRQLFVVPSDGDELWSYDLDEGLLRDVNPWVTGPQGMRFNAPVSGIEAIPIPYLQLEENDNGVRDFDRSVAVSLASGRVVFADERTACLVRDPFGPQTNLSGQLTVSTDYSISYTSTGATLGSNASNERHVLGNPCAGVTRTQNWYARFDELRQGWEVVGSRSGLQATLAYEDIRYISDDGEVSFLIESGESPSQDGWRIDFRMLEGITAADGDEDGVAATLEITLDQPSDPLYFHYLVGAREGGWLPEDDRPHVLVAGQSADRVGRVDPQEGTIDATWD